MTQFRITSRLSTRRLLLAALFLAIALAAIGPTVTHAQQQVVVQIGYQKGGLFSYLKQKGTIEQTLGSGYKVVWTLFPAGPQTFEAMNAGGVDFTSTGNTPPIFAQAGGVPVVYVAATLSRTGEALIVPPNSPIKTAADIKGKKIAFNFGSAAQYFILQVLQKTGLQYSDIQPLNLAPADARAAFDGGSIDAWAIWDPFLTIAVNDSHARVIIQQTDVGAQYGFYEASRPFVTAHPEVISKLLDLFEQTTTNLQNPANIEDYVQTTAAETGIPVDIWRKVATAGLVDLQPLTDDIVAQQQAIVDQFYALKLIPTDIQIKDAVWIGSDLKPVPAATGAATTAATAAPTAQPTAAATAAS